MADETMRADMLLCTRGLAASREKAQGLIQAGLVYADGRRIDKASRRVPSDCSMEVRGEIYPYVSRGGFKLEKALDVFNVDVNGAVALDVGASTGGFTDVLLQHGALLIYAVDVGTAQLDPKLAADPRVVSMERLNARTLTPDMFPEHPLLAVMDVSFISILKILPALRSVLGEHGRVITLVKPQFEAGRAALNKSGVVSSPSAHEQVLCELVSTAPELGWQVRALDYSPIQGGNGNIEYLAYLIPVSNANTSDILANINNASPDSTSIRDLVRHAHAQFKHR